jgi:polyphosphate kinase
LLAVKPRPPQGAAEQESERTLKVRERARAAGNPAPGRINGERYERLAVLRDPSGSIGRAMTAVSAHVPTARPIVRRRGRPAAGAARYINRELSWLEFNARVLHEAEDERNPLLERVKFLAIFASNLDEFFSVRIAGLRHQVGTGSAGLSPDGRTAAAQIAASRELVIDLVARHSAAYAQVRERLTEAGVRIVDYEDVPEHHEVLRQRFLDEIFPVLTPLAVDPGHPFPYISSLSLSIAVGLRDPESGESRFARVKVPPSLPRLVEIERHTFVLIDQIIEANLDLLFSGMQIVDAHMFRVTRNADLAIEEDEADDLLLAIEEEVRRRRFGAAVRLEVERSMPPATKDLLLRGIGLAGEDLYEVAGMLDLTGLWALADLDIPELRSEPWAPVTPVRLAPPDEDEPADVFAAVRAADILVHHPYESFAASVERFIVQAAADPDVLTIKQTIYRTSGDSPIVHALIGAAEAGKQVVVLVELKARLDEEANISWARKLEQAGAHVVYGLVGLKTHSKAVLVVRREGSFLRRYVHIGTGNYNPRTARQYTDLGLMTCRPEIGADVTDLFNVLTGLSRQQSFRRLLVAPMTMRTRLAELIERETFHAEAGREARIVIKTNAVVDVPIMDALYRASQAGVSIDLICRGICMLLPGVPGMSERISVRSIVGEYLEHSRIWHFANGGEPEWLIGSADLMDRNLDRRIEVATPVEDAEARRRLGEIVDIMLADDRHSWQLGSDGRWLRTEVMNGRAGSISAFDVLRDQAMMAGELAATPHRPRSGAGSLDPRA